jgi:hypothetical protein
MKGVETLTAPPSIAIRTVASALYECIQDKNRGIGQSHAPLNETSCGSYAGK